MNSEFGIRNSEFPTALPQVESHYAVRIATAEKALGTRGGGAEFKIQNSKFKIRKNVGWTNQ